MRAPLKFVYSRRALSLSQNWLPDSCSLKAYLKRGLMTGLCEAKARHQMGQDALVWRQKRPPRITATVGC